MVTSIVERLYNVAGIHARDTPPQRARAQGMRDAAAMLEDIIGPVPSTSATLSVRLGYAMEAISAAAVDLERAGFSQTEIKMALDGARQERMR